MNIAIGYAYRALRLGKRDRFFLDDLSYAHWLLSELELNPVKKEGYFDMHTVYRNFPSNSPYRNFPSNSPYRNFPSNSPISSQPSSIS